MSTQKNNSCLQSSSLYAAPSVQMVDSKQGQIPSELTKVEVHIDEHIIASGGPHVSNAIIYEQIARALLDKCEKRSDYLVKLKEAKGQKIYTKNYCRYHDCNYEDICRICQPARFKELHPKRAFEIKKQQKRNRAVKKFFQKKEEKKQEFFVPVHNKFEKLRKVSFEFESNYTFKKVKIQKKKKIVKFKIPKILITNFDKSTQWICPSWIKEAHYRLNWFFDNEKQPLIFKNQALDPKLIQVITKAVDRQFKLQHEADEFIGVFALILENFNPPTLILRFEWPNFSDGMRQKLNAISFEIIREYYLAPSENAEEVAESLKDKYDKFMQRFDLIAPKFMEQYMKLKSILDRFIENINHAAKEPIQAVKQDCKTAIDNFVEFFTSKPKEKVSFNKENEEIKIEISQVESLKDKFFKKFLLGSTFLQNIPTPSLDEFYELMGTLKPINFMNLIGMLAAAKTGKETIAIMTAISELYGLFWNDELIQLQDLIIQTMAWIASGFLVCLWDSDRTAQGFHNQGLISMDDNSCVKDLFSKFSIPFPESFDDISLKVIAGILMGFLILTGGKVCSLSNLTFKKLEKRVKNISTDVKSLNNLIEGVPKLWNFAINEISTLFGFTFESAMSKDVKDFKAELIAFKQETVLLAEMMKTQPQTLLMDPAKLTSARTSLQRLDNLYESLLKQKENMSATKTIFDDIKQQMKIITNFVDNLKLECCNKIEPFVLVLDGLPEVGKSTFIKYFKKKFEEKLHKEHPELAHLKGTTYVRNCGDKYWSGYAGQMFVVYDDFSQMKDDVDHQDLMSYKNPNKTLLNMAELSEKGTLFSSIGVIICTNQGVVSSSATVKCTPALNRRFEINIYVSDPNLDKFKELHGCSPGAYEKTHFLEGRKAMWEDTEGKPIPYYDPDYNHLTFFLRNPDPKIQDEEIIKADKIIDLAFAFYSKYKQDYLESSVPVMVTADEFNDADSDNSQSSQRSIDTYDAAQKRARRSVVKEEELALKIKSDKLKIVKEVLETATPTDRVAILDASIARQARIRAARKQARRMELEENSIFEDSEDIFSNQGLPARSTSQAFVNTTMTKGKIFCIYGDPGTGKSTAVNTICELANIPKLVANNLNLTTVLDKPAYYIEDITIDAEHFEFCRKLIMQVYDGNSPIQNLIVTLNPSLIKDFVNNDEVSIAFWRRMHCFQFTFGIKEKNWFKKDIYYTPADLEHGGVPHCKAVNIMDITLSTFQKCIFFECQQLVDYISKEMIKVDLNAYKNIITRSVPYIAKDDVVAGFHVTYTGTANELFSACYETPTKLVSMILQGKAKLLAGDLRQGMQIAQQFTGPTAARPDYPGDIDNFIIMINNSQFTSKISFTVKVECSDSTIVIMPKKNDPFTIRCFKQCDKLVVNRNTVSDDDEEHESTEIVYREYTEHLETIQAVASELPKKLEEAEIDCNNTTGFLSLFAKFPTLKKVCKIFLFLFKMYIAGTSIMQLLSISKERFLGASQYMPFYSEAKGKQKTMRAMNTHKFVKNKVLKKFGKSGYDNIRAFVDQYGTTAAKQAKVSDLLTTYYMTGDRQQDTWHDMLEFMEHVDEDDLACLEDESREVIVKDKPTLDPAPELMLESTKAPIYKKDFAQAEPTVLINEALIDPGCISVAEKVCKNTIEVGYVRDGEFSRRVFGLMLTGNYGVTVQHFIVGDTFWIRDQKRTPKAFQVKILVRVVDKDYCFFKIEDKNFAPYPNIINLFPKDQNSMKTDYTYKFGLLITSDFRKGQIYNTFRNIKLHTTQCVKILDDGSPRDCFVYSGYATGVDYYMPMLTQAGDCGSFVMVNDTSVEKKVLGIHNSGDETRGACTLLFQNLIKKYIEPSVFKNQCFFNNSVPPKYHNIPYQKLTDQTILGMRVIADLKEETHQPVTTKFWDSPLALVKPDDNPFAPSVLSERDPRNMTTKHPFYNSIEKWNHEQPVMDRDEVFRIAEEIGLSYADIIKQEGIQTKILTKTEAVNAGREYEIKGLNRDSSPGYPWRKYFAKVGDILDSVNINNSAYYKIKTNELGQKFLRSIDNIIEICSTNGNYPLISFAGALKDEPIKVQKIFDVNTRSFAGAPLDYTIASRMYFATIQGAIHSVRRLMPIQIGIDPTSLEWNTMMKRLLTVSDFGTDADFKNWDGSIPSVMLEAVSVVYNVIAQNTNPDWLPIHDQIRTAMCNSLKKPNLIVPLDGNTYIVQAPGGMPSGSPRTADDNSIIHLILLRMCWDHVCEEHGYPEFANQTTFMDNVQAMIYGDDGGYSIHPAVLHFFNFESIAKFFKSINMICTPASKDNQILKYKPIIDLEFLKRNTVKIGPHYYGALQKKTFNKMLGYCLGRQHQYFKDIGRSDFKTMDLVQTAHSCLLESLYHGPQFYNEMRNHLVNCFDKLDLTEHLPRYRDLALQRSLPILQ